MKSLYTCEDSEIEKWKRIVLMGRKWLNELKKGLLNAIEKEKGQKLLVNLFICFLPKYFFFFSSRGGWILAGCSKSSTSDETTKANG